VHLPEPVERECGEQGEPEREEEATACDAGKPAAQLFALDLQSCEEEKEGKPIQREHLDRLVDRHSPEN
jgi:hypothetical protein